MHSDSISDMLARIKNAYLAGLPIVVLPWSKSKASLAEVLKKNHYIESLATKETDGKTDLVLKLNGSDKIKNSFNFKRVSKPSLRRYANKDSLPRVVGGLGIAIISTPMGLLTDREARKKGVGGEIWCEIW